MVFSGHEAPVKSVEFGIIDDDDGEDDLEKIVVVSGDTLGVVNLWSCDNSGGGVGLVGSLSGEDLPNPPSSPSSPPQPNDPPTSSPNGWRVTSLHTYHHHSVPIRSVRFAGTSNRIVSCDATGKVLVVSGETGEVLTEFIGGNVTCGDWEYWAPSGGGGAHLGGGGYFLVTASLTR